MQINDYNICELAADFLRNRGGNASYVFSMTSDDLKNTLDAVTGKTWRGSDEAAGKVLVDFVRKKCICLTITI